MARLAAASGFQYPEDTDLIRGQRIKEDPIRAAIQIVGKRIKTVPDQAEQSLKTAGAEFHRAYRIRRQQDGTESTASEG